MSIRVITTGGTIAQTLGGPNVSHVSGSDLLARLVDAGVPQGPWEVESSIELPSTFIGPEDMLQIAEAVRRAELDENVRGIVVTHGTGTIEETIYFVDLVVAAAKPVVFTGAQRFSASLGYDGLRNLQDAITVAGATEARGLGAVLVMDGEVHAAREVAEIHPSSLAGFQSLGFGPIGRVDLDRVVIARTPRRDEPVADVRLPLARVDLVMCYAGMAGDVVEARTAHGAKGLVIQGMTSGAIPPALVQPVRDALAAGVVVVIGTRCPAGRVVRRSDLYKGVAGYGHDLEELGVALTDLGGLKARCRLIALLSSGIPRAEVHRRMDTAA